ncbi:MAG: nucleoside-triphosphatase [bacterium]
MPLIITGPINSGKSTFVHQFARELLPHHITIGGIFNLPVFELGTKIGYDAHSAVFLSLLTQQSLRIIKGTPFARLKSLVPHPAKPDLEFGQWIIFYDGIHFCVQQIEQAIQSQKQVIFIDEIGPLELAGQGFRSILDTILVAGNELPYQLILVVRDSAVEKVKALYPNQTFTIYNVSETKILDILNDLKA